MNNLKKLVIELEKELNVRWKAYEAAAYEIKRYTNAVLCAEEYHTVCTDMEHVDENYIDATLSELDRKFNDLFSAIHFIINHNKNAQKVIRHYLEIKIVEIDMVCKSKKCICEVDNEIN